MPRGTIKGWVVITSIGGILWFSFDTLKSRCTDKMDNWEKQEKDGFKVVRAKKHPDGNYGEILIKGDYEWKGQEIEDEEMSLL